MSASRDRVLRFPSPPEQRIAGWRFAAGELSLAAEQLRVGGAEVSLSPMVFRLLCSLLRQPGELYTRARAFETLWPGGGVASDEALAQIVARLRSALEGSGLSLVTVRGRGYRLDGAVQPWTHDEIAATAADPPTPAAAPADVRPTTAPAPPAVAQPRGRIARLAVVLVLLALLAGGLAWWRTPADIPALRGLGLDAGSVAGWSAESRLALDLALAAGARGERAEQRQLLLALLDSEPASPLPPLLLAMHDGAAAMPEAARWRALLSERPGPAGDGYWPLLVHTVLATGIDPRVEIEALDAALGLRPQAFELRFARAHAHLRLRQLDAARSDLRALPLAAMSARQALVAVSDRIALGEPGLLDALPPALAGDAAATAYLAGLRALVAGEYAPAEAAFADAARRVDPGQMTGTLRTALLYAGVAAMEQGDPRRAIAHWEQAREAARGHAHVRGLLDVEPLLAFAWDRIGDAAARDARLAQLAGVLAGDGSGLGWLVARRLAPQLALPVPAATDAAHALVEARAAWAACELAAARAALQRAQLAGIERGWLAEEARLLAADLDGHADPQAAPLLPYPLFAVWVTHWASSQARACAGPQDGHGG